MCSVYCSTVSSLFLCMFIIIIVIIIIIIVIAVLRHNSLRDVVAQFCHRARLGGQLEVGGGTEADGS